MITLPGLQSQTIEIKGSFLHYLEAGSGHPIVFLHGNPTYSFLWRNVIPLLAKQARCVAVDYIGMGYSTKPEIGYRLEDHIEYIEAFLEALNLEQVTLVAHDWGVVIGLALCRRQPDRIRRIAFMEGHIHVVESWSDFDVEARAMFQKLRSEALGPELIMKQNFFIEQVLPSGVKRTLTTEEMDAYRAPYPDEASRKPLLQWVREIPIEGEPVDVHDIVQANRQYLAASSMPKLLLYGEPGAVITSGDVTWCETHCRNLTARCIGPGIHFLPEDNPNLIGEAIRIWLESQE